MTTHTAQLLVEGIHCAACVQRIERTLGRLPGVVRARVNFTTRRLALAWDGPAERTEEFIQRLDGLGFRAVPFEAERMQAAGADEEAALLRALAVAGFAAGNVMLLSVGVWTGLVEDMGPATRTLFYWISALIALPAIAYAGRPFFTGALSAIRAGRLGMDVPITVGLLLTAGISVFETLRGGEHAYFDAGVSLLFFLLAGRYLDARARGRARAAAAHLLGLRVKAATRLTGSGQEVVPLGRVVVGDLLLVAAGESIPADGIVTHGRSAVDTSALTGESLPEAAGPGTAVHAGTMNLEAPLTLRVTAIGEGTLLAEIVRLMETAEQGRARHVVLADRAARLYAPVVHLLALAAFAGWMIAGAAFHQALLVAAAVLIVTCPCALGLAVPAVQVVACGRLMRRGVLLKSATALERLAEADTIVFDKTGTLTEGRPVLLDDPARTARDLHLAASLAAASRHPLARALAAAVPGCAAAVGVEEVPGQGLRLGEVRLGSRRFVGVPEGVDAGGADAGAEMWLRQGDGPPLRFAFADALRPDAAAVVAGLASRFRVLLLSGDRAAAVAPVAAALGLAEWEADCLPQRKVERLAALAAEGRRVLMVGDGLNDAPALAAAHASLSPATAADISQTAADAVFQGRLLAPVAETIATARQAAALVRQNLVLSIAYNLVTVPLAMAGLVTPLIAAIAMSASSLTVVGNALRLGWRR
ncbi:MAG: heavy metal translocating P-type ATPase metal-binding domain-containing protein [Thalassobaculales bacterium]